MAAQNAKLKSAEPIRNLRLRRGNDIQDITDLGPKSVEGHFVHHQEVVILVRIAEESHSAHFEVIGCRHGSAEKGGRPNKNEGNILAIVVTPGSSDDHAASSDRDDSDQNVFSLFCGMIQI